LSNGPAGRPARNRKPLLILAAIAGGVAVAAAGGYLAVRLVRSNEAVKGSPENSVAKGAKLAKDIPSLAHLEPPAPSAASAGVSTPAISPDAASPAGKTAVGTGQVVIPLPSIDEFEQFGGKLAAAMQRERETYWKKIEESEGGKSEHSTDTKVINADYKKSDSLINPTVGVLVIRESYHVISKGSDGGLLFTNSKVEKLTASFGFRNGRWIPVKVTEILQKDDYFPPLRDGDVIRADPIGQEKELSVVWLKKFSDEVQQTSD
jgi:hypothetical protein